MPKSITADYHRCADCEHCVREGTVLFQYGKRYNCLKKQFSICGIKYYHKCKFFHPLMVEALEVI